MPGKKIEEEPIIEVEESDVWYELHTPPLSKNHSFCSKHTSSVACGILYKTEDPLKLTSLKLPFKDQNSTNEKKSSSANISANDLTNRSVQRESVNVEKCNKKLKKLQSSKKIITRRGKRTKSN